MAFATAIYLYLCSKLDFTRCFLIFPVSPRFLRCAQHVRYYGLYILCIYPSSAARNVPPKNQIMLLSPECIILRAFNAILSMLAVLAASCYTSCFARTSCNDRHQHSITLTKTSKKWTSRARTRVFHNAHKNRRVNVLTSILEARLSLCMLAS